MHAARDADAYNNASGTLQTTASPPLIMLTTMRKGYRCCFFVPHIDFVLPLNPCLIGASGEF
jgi:hypothetical protein